MTTSRRNIVELEELDTDITEIPELIESLNETITNLNFILKQLTYANFDGQIKDVTILAGATLKINHRLKGIPAHRMILRQSGGGVIRDGVFNENYIELINDGASSAKLTIIINKG